MNRLARLARVRAVEHQLAVRAALDAGQEAKRAGHTLGRIEALLATLAPRVSQSIGAANLATDAARRDAFGIARAAAAGRAASSACQSADALRVSALTRARAETVARFGRERARAAETAAERRALEDMPALALRLHSSVSGGWGG